MVELKREAWATIWPEAEPMMRAHRDEVDPEAARCAWAPKPEGFAAMDEAGLFLGMVAREAGQLIAYCLWTVSPSLESSALLATQGPWYVVPDWRHSSIGLRLFKASLGELRTMGVQRAFPHHWALGGGDRLGQFFRRLGAEPLETVYSLWLED